MKGELQINVRWADVDQNGHVRHSAYYDYGAHARITLIQQHGYGPDELRKIRLGPVLFKETCSFIREIKLNEVVTVRTSRGEMSDDGRKWELHHELFNTEGKKAAHITAQGAWMDLVKRAITLPPSEIVEGFRQLDQGAPYVYQKK